ncbi:hypothetical protein KEF29_03085 [Streptomyces tuirus]|uniref:Uncharacterized protein n=1 Tax=Streptomyces tuirus TaxID=68278 RepID=A0A941F7W6_9ACTN|nr:hypothetical protein [Streptomyces tuirus]
MRVRVTKETTAYWNYAVQTFKEGQELTGDLAELLADNAPAESIEVLEDDRPAQPEPDADAGQGEGGEPPAELDIEGTAKEVLAWVGDDPDRAAEALEAEQAKDSPRSTLVKTLQKIADAEDAE